MKRLNALEFRKHFGSILDQVHGQKKPLTILRGNRPLVVLLPYDEYEKKRKREEELKGRAKGFQKLLEWRSQQAKKLKGFDAVKAIRKMRDAR